MLRDNTLLPRGDNNLIAGSKVIKLVKRFQCNLLAENVAPEPVWKRLGDLVLHVNTSGNCENVVQLFEGALLGFGDPKEDHDQSSHVQATSDG
jgi:uncharacterized protein YhfF